MKENEHEEIENDDDASLVTADLSSPTLNPSNDLNDLNLVHHSAIKAEAFLPPLSIRLCALGLCIFLNVGPNVCFSGLGGISTLVLEHYHIGFEQLGQVFSVYSLPNLVLTLIGGSLVDKYGVYKCGIVLSGLVVLGSLLPLLSPSSFSALLVGRIIYGIGGESLGAVQFTLFQRWFANDSKISTTFSASLSLFEYRMTQTAVLNILPFIVEAFSFQAGLAVFFLTAFASFCAMVSLPLLEKYILRQYPSYSLSPVGGGSDTFQFQHVLRLSPLLWTMAAMTIAFYGSSLVFLGFAQDLITKEHNFSVSDADFLVSLVPIVSAFGVLLSAKIVERIGKRVSHLIIGCILLTFAMLLFFSKCIHPAIGFVVLGVSYSIFPAAFWPSPPLLVEGALVGTAYGILGCSNNIGLFFMNLIAGNLRSQSSDYTSTLKFLVSVSIAAIVISIFMYFLDKQHGSKLETYRERQQSEEIVSAAPRQVVEMEEISSGTPSPHHTSLQNADSLESLELLDDSDQISLLRQ